MIKKTITYTDFNDEKQTDSFYFNLTKAELIEMELSNGGKQGFAKMLERIVASEDNAQIIAEFKKIIKNSYGVRSDDGKRFIKNEEVFNEFAQTAAYSELFIELSTNADIASEFINGVMPSDMNIEDIQELSARQKSEQAMEGFNKKTQKNVEPSVEVVGGTEQETVKSSDDDFEARVKAATEAEVARLNREKPTLPEQ